MKMKSEIWVGLSYKARTLVVGERKEVGKKYTISVFNDGRSEIRSDPVPIVEFTVRRAVNGQYKTGEGEIYDLHEYRMPDGRILVECVQEKVAIGYFIYVLLALEDVSAGQTVKESLWTRQEINSRIAGLDDQEVKMAEAGYSPS
jgi:hypothetical protein